MFERKKPSEKRQKLIKNSRESFCSEKEKLVAAKGKILVGRPEKYATLEKVYAITKDKPRKREAKVLLKDRSISLLLRVRKVASATGEFAWRGENCLKTPALLAYFVQNVILIYILFCDYNKIGRLFYENRLGIIS